MTSWSVTACLPRLWADDLEMIQSMASTVRDRAVESAHQHSGSVYSARRADIAASCVLAVIAVATVFFYWPSWLHVGAFFPSWEHMAGRTILLISAWLAWRERSTLAAGQAFWPGIPVLLALGVLWLIALAADVLNVQMLLLPLLLLTAVLAYFGPKAAQALVFPAAYLYLAMPIAMLVQAPLHALTTRVTSFLAYLSGIPALVEGNFVTIPAGRFEIADGCAGQGYFIYAAAVASLYAYLRLDSWPRRVLLVAVGLVLAMVMNWIRVISVILIGHYSDMQHYVVRVEHESLGWSLYAVAMVILFWVGTRLESEEKKSGEPPESVPAGAKPLRPVALVVTLAVLGAAPAIWAMTGTAGAALARAPSLAAPPPPPGWSLETQESLASGWRPAYSGADSEVNVRYRSDEAEIDVWLMLYATQSQGKELVSGENEIAHTGTWSIDSRRRLSSDPPMNEAILTSLSGGTRVVRWWYEVGGWNTAGPIGAKLRQVAGRLTGRPEAGLVALSAPCDSDCVEARDRLDRFSGAASGALRAAIYAYRFEEEKP